METALTIHDFEIGEIVLDTFNGFCNQKTKFIKGQSYNEELAHCKIIDKTKHSICVALKKFPLAIIKKNGGITNPIECTHWFRFVRENDTETVFPVRFKKV